MTKYTTDDINHKKFMPHGSVELTITDDNILIYTAAGPFDEELIKAVASLEELHLDKIQKQGGKWSDIVIFEYSCMATPDLLIAFTPYLKSFKEKYTNFAASAFVITGVIEGAGIMMPLYKKCYEDAGVPFSIFDNQSEAISWLKDKMS